MSPNTSCPHSETIKKHDVDLYKVAEGRQAGLTYRVQALETYQDAAEERMAEFRETQDAINNKFWWIIVLLITTIVGIAVDIFKSRSEPVQQSQRQHQQSDLY